MRFQALYSVRFYWIIGILLAALGVITARVIAPTLEGKARSGLTAAGQIIAVSGLITITFGIRKRIWSQGSTDSAPGGNVDRGDDAR